VGEAMLGLIVEITFHPHHQTFTALLSRDGLAVNGHQIHQLNGHWTRQQGILATAVVVAPT